VAAALSVAMLLHSCGGSKAEPETMTAKLSADHQQVSADRGSIFLSVAASGSWTLSLSFSGAESSWASLSVTSGSGSKNSVILSYDANTSTASRTVTVTLKAGQLSSSVTLTQQGLTPSGGDQGDGGRESVSIPSWLELPAVPADDDLELFIHDMTFKNVKQRNYSFWWDYSNLVSRWVAYPLNSSLIGSGNRSDAWGLDPLLPESKQPVLEKAYANGNGGWYSRGHQIPSADRLASGINETTFYGTNMTPQDNDFNGGIWAVLESQVRSWSKNCDTLYVVTGCTLDGSTKYCYDNKGKKVTVPTGYYKAVLRYAKVSTIGYGDENNGYFIGCGFYFDHSNNYGSSLKKSMMLSIDELEKKIGIDLFVNLPSVLGEEKAAQVEAQDPKTVSKWGLND